MDIGGATIHGWCFVCDTILYIFKLREALTYITLAPAPPESPQFSPIQISPILRVYHQLWDYWLCGCFVLRQLLRANGSFKTERHFEQDRHRKDLR